MYALSQFPLKNCLKNGGTWFSCETFTKNMNQIDLTLQWNGLFKFHFNIQSSIIYTEEHSHNQDRNLVMRNKVKLHYTEMKFILNS